MLRSALAGASDEARARGLRPEELIIALKRLAAEVYRTEVGVSATDGEEYMEFVAWLVTACLKAYFGR